MFVLSFVRSPIFVALLALGAALLVAAACGGDGDGEETPVADETPAGGTAAEIKMVPTIKFDKTELTIAADTGVTITADNADTGISHNFAVYASRDDADNGEGALAATETCTAPCTDAATLDLVAGEYFFRCDVHPAQMTGTLVVE